MQFPKRRHGLLGGFRLKTETCNYSNETFWLEPKLSSKLKSQDLER